MSKRRDRGAFVPRLRKHHRWLYVAAAVSVLLLAACAVAPSPSATLPAPTATPQAPTPTARQPTETPIATETPPPTPTSRPTETSVPPTPSTPSPTPTSTPTTPASPSPTPSPTATPTPTPAAQAPEPTIYFFEANVDVADPGDTITLSWHWSGADRGDIYHLFSTGQLSEPHWEVEPTGSLEYTISPDRRNYDTFVLFLTNDDAGLVAQETVQIRLRCPDEWFFSPAPDICPRDEAIVTDGAEEHFERGTMLWNRAQGVIYVLFDDDQYPRWRGYADEWEEGDPVSDPDIEPPSGFYQPVRGFGLVWRQNLTVRERLGWAVDPEQAYRTAIQRTSHPRYSDLYIRALDGGVWRLGPNGDSWEHVTTTGN
jgi:hypothetical protein